MLQAMFSGVSGLQVHQTKLDVIGNNIANVNTVGYKSGSVTFEDQLSQTLRASSGPSASIGGQNPAQVGLGVTLGAIDINQAQGNLQSTGNNTDLAIQGSGMFPVSSGNSVFYTRDGSFNLDSDGILVNPASGLKLLGYVADSSGTIDYSQQIDSGSVLKVPVGTLTSVKQTTQAALQGNLDASAGLQSTKVVISGDLDTSQPAPTINTTAYDALGNAHPVQVTLSNGIHLPAPGPGVPAGATQRWDVAINVGGVAQPTSKLYAVPNGAGGNAFVFADPSNPGVPLGSTVPVNVSGSAGSPSLSLSIDFSKLAATSAITTSANGQSGVNPIQSTLLSLNGSLNLDGGSSVVNTSTVYDASGNGYSVQTTLSNPMTPVPGANVPVGATQQWDMKVGVTPPTGAAFTAYDSSVASNQESKVYFVPGTGFITADSANPATPLGSTIQLVAGGLPATTFNQGKQIGTNFPLTIDLGAISTTKIQGVSDGQTGGPPTWDAQVSVFDGLGVKHNVNFKFDRVLVGSGAPATAAARWEWTATDNGAPIANSSTPGNNPLFFDTKGALIDQNKQTLTVNPKGGASPLAVTIDFSTLTQLAGSSSVVSSGQDGFAVGTLQGFQISPEGLVTGNFSNGQTRTLGQIATVGFSNAAGLQKQGQNLFTESNNSGPAQIGLPGANGRGKISTGFVEMSNVDLSNEFTSLIITQRGFQANTRIITVVDTLLQDVIDLKR